MASPLKLDTGQEPNLLVVELFWHNRYEPFAILLEDNEEDLKYVLTVACNLFGDRRWRTGCTQNWGGVEATVNRISWAFGTEHN
jgi:hypothetical protein